MDERLGEIPAAHVLQLTEVLAQWGIASADLFAGLDLGVERLADPLARLPLSVVGRIAERARALTNDPALGVQLGKQMRVSTHGYVGLAAMTSSTVRDALEIGLRYAPTRTSALALRLHVEGDDCALVIAERAPLGPARELVILAILVGIAEIGRVLTGKDLDGVMEVTFARPTGPEAERTLAGYRIRFEQPVHQLVFPASVLDLPIAFADPVARRMVEEQCERELSILQRQDDPRQRVRALLARREGGFRSVRETAALAGMSERTLKRRLAECGTTFSELLEDERRERALLLLRSPKLSVEDVAERLGYTDVANFTRAFRRWTGTSPTSYRRRSRA